MSSLEQEGLKTLGIGKKHASKTFSQIYNQDQQYVHWVLSEPRNGKLGEFADWCKRKQHAAAPSTPARAPSADINRGTESRTRTHAFVCRVHKIMMDGPKTSRNGEAHNVGRQFYTCKYNGRMGAQRREADGETDCGVDGFKWADGTDAFSAASCRRAEVHAGAPPNSIGVGIGAGPFQFVADELRAGPNGFQGLDRGGVPVNVQPLGGKRRRDDDDDNFASPRFVGGRWRCPRAPSGRLWVQDAEAAHFNEEPFLIDENDFDANYCAV